jgi:hypothetical protein
VLARYEAGEHSQFGTAGQTVTIDGFTFDQRYLVSMGDYYRDLDKLKGAKADELKELVALIQRDEDARTGKGGTSPKESDWQGWSRRWRSGDDIYMELNKRNEHHFTPINKEWWEKYHRSALKTAQADGNGSGVVSEKARLLNGFGLHFLTDAFSAGHMIDKLLLMKNAKPSLTSGTNQVDLARAIARGILATKKCTDALAGQEIKHKAVLGDWGPVTEDRMTSLLDSVMWWKTGAFLSVFARVAHDELNQSVATTNASGTNLGLWVENDAGDRWQLAGDETLEKSPTTKAIVRKAVQASEANLATAAAMKNTPAWEFWAPNLPEATIRSMLDNVWKFVPRPTKTALSGEHSSGSAQVADVVARATNAADAGTIKAIVALSIDQFDTALDELRSNGLIRPAPVPAGKP